MNNKEELFFDVCKRVKDCTKCPRMADSARILGPSSGEVSAKIMFIGEAPGRLGADGSGIPFHGDKAGHNFEEFLNQVGISRYDIFITNAVLCNPKDEKGNNATPNKNELANCNSFLKEQIDIVDPAIVVTLGATALAALSSIEEHQLALKESVRTAKEWYNRLLTPLYHPGQRAMVHRNFHNQLSDYQFVAETYRRLNKSKRRFSQSRIKNDVIPILESILRHRESISYFALHKLFYLIEYNLSKHEPSTLTNAYFIRQKDGPYCTDLHISKIKKSLPNIEVSFKGKIPYLSYRNQLSLLNSSAHELSPEQENVVFETLAKYGQLKNEQLKTAVYMTKPMRNILKLEKNLGLNMYNKQIRFC